MLRTIKTLLLWLLLAALPLQGIASAAMMSCQSTGSAVPAMPAAHTVGLHAHHHAMQDGAPAAQDEAWHHDHSAHQAHSPHGKHDVSTSCSSCAACCIGSAMPSSPLDWASVHNDSEPVAIVPVSPATGFIPGGLERPPRTALS